MTFQLTPCALLIGSWINADFVKVISWFAQYLACLTSMQSTDLRMLLKSSSLVAWVDFELHRNKVSFEKEGKKKSSEKCKFFNFMRVSIFKAFQRSNKKIEGNVV